MTNEIKNYVIEQTHALLNAPSACSEVKAAAEKWLAAVGTADEKAETERYIQELKEDVETIDELLAFVHSPLCKQIFGDRAEGFALHAEQLKKDGAKYCDCPACTAGANILEKESEILA